MTEAGFGWVNGLVLAGYLIVLVLMGVYFARKKSNLNQYFLAGGRMPAWAAGISIFATMLSAITYLSIPATVYATDWTRFLLNMGIPLVAPIVIFFYLPFYRKLNVTTAYEYLEQRFDVSIRLLGSASFILFQMGRMGVVVLLPALALSAVTGLNLYLCIALMGLLSTLYTVLGGIEAVIWTDVLQTVVLLGGAILALIIMAIDLPGGMGQVVADASASGKFNFANPGWGLVSDSLFVLVVGMVFANLLPYATDQAVIQRYLTTSSQKESQRAIWTGALLAVPASILFFFVGTALFVYYLEFPDQLAALDSPDQLFPWFIVNEMPAGLAGLVIAGIFAAAMSSLDSSIHAMATAITTDFVRRFRPGQDDRSALKLARQLTVGLGIAGTLSAMTIASMDLGALWATFLDIIGLFLGTLGGLFTVGIFTRYTTSTHLWVGALVSVGLLAIAKYATELNGLLYGAIATISCVLVAWLGSLIFRPAQSAPAHLTIFRD